MKIINHTACTSVACQQALSFEAQRSAFHSQHTHSCQSSNLIHFLEIFASKSSQKNLTSQNMHPARPRSSVIVAPLQLRPRTINSDSSFV